MCATYVYYGLKSIALTCIFMTEKLTEKSIQAAFSHTVKLRWCQTLPGNTEYITAHLST